LNFSKAPQAAAGFGIFVRNAACELRAWTYGGRQVGRRGICADWTYEPTHRTH